MGRRAKLKTILMRLNDAIYKSFPLDTDPTQLRKWSKETGIDMQSDESTFEFAKRLRVALIKELAHNGLDRAGEKAHDYRQA